MPPAQLAGRRIEPPARDSAWGRIAAAGTQVGTSTARSGTAIGQRAKKAGLSAAGFFTRAGKGVADSF